MKRLLPGLLLLLSTLSPSFGQSPVQAEASLIVSSAYLWRGEKVCGFHLQPGAAIKIGRFTIENSDYISLDGKYQEVDLGVSYSFGELSVHLADYYSHTEGGAYDSGFFNWQKHSTCHTDEFALVYSGSHIPLKARWFTFFWGDWLPDAAGRRGELSLSSYFELEAFHTMGDFGTMSAVLGTSVGKGPYTSYTEDIMPILAGLYYTKTFEASGVRFPLKASIVLNPYNRNCFAGISAGIAF